ncbi:MAG: tectonic family protein, partial [Deltaproteobacteria bacterium]|nr:tectonic family protein [Deltaproteobacteria bacterium]
GVDISTDIFSDTIVNTDAITDSSVKDVFSDISQEVQDYGTSDIYKDTGVTDTSVSGDTTADTGAKRDVILIDNSSECLCDETYACDPDCECDPECSEIPVENAGGCGCSVID